MTNVAAPTAANNGARRAVDEPPRGDTIIATHASATANAAVCAAVGEGMDSDVHVVSAHARATQRTAKSAPDPVTAHPRSTSGSGAART